MTDPNVYRPEWKHERNDPPFRRRLTRLGSRSGASEIGVSLYEIDPGGAIAPYHIHHGNEELLLVLSGTPQLRTPDGVRTLEAGALVAFPRGPAGAHRIANHSPEPVTLLIFSTMNFPEVAEYPDTGTWLALTEPMDRKVFRRERTRRSWIRSCRRCEQRPNTKRRATERPALPHVTHNSPARCSTGRSPRPSTSASAARSARPISTPVMARFASQTS